MQSVYILSVLLLQWVTADQTFDVVNQATSAYVFTPGGSNPALTVTVGETITFNVNAPGHPFLIKTVQETGPSNTYDDGVTNNGADQGTVTWVVQSGAPATLYYQCELHSPMTGTITVNEDASTTGTTGTTGSTGNSTITGESSTGESTTTGEATTTGEDTTGTSDASTTTTTDSSSTSTGESTTGDCDGTKIAACAYLLLALIALLI